MVRDRVNTTKLALTALDFLVNDLFQQAVKKHKLWPISQPEVKLPQDIRLLEKLFSNQNRLPKYTIEYIVEVRPEIKIKDYEHLPISRPSVIIKETEIDQSIQQLFNEWKKKQPQEARCEIATAATLAEAEKKAQKENRQSKEKLAKLTKQAPDDDWAKMIGEQNLESLRKKVKKLLLNIKRANAEHQLEELIFNFLIASAPDLELPETLVKTRLEQEEKQLTKQLEQTQSTIEEFLKQRNLTIDQLRDRWRQAIERNLKIDLILNHIAQEQNIKASDQEVDDEINQISDSKIREQFENQAQREYIKYMLRQRKVVSWLKERIGKSP